MTNLPQRIAAYELNVLADGETIELFCELINTGLILSLQDKFQAAARDLINCNVIIFVDGKAEVNNDDY